MGTITFGGERNGPVNIFTADTATGSTKQLTNTNYCHAPSWSADGRQLAFLSGGDDWEDLMVMPSGGQPRRLLGYVGRAKPAWSPDDRRLACVTRHPDANIDFDTREELSIVDAATGRWNRHCPVKGNANLDEPIGFSKVEWSPAGNRAVTMVSGPDYGMDRILVFDPDTGHAIHEGPTGQGDSGPTWSPSGDALAFVSEPGDDFASHTVWVCAADTSSRRRIADVRWSSHPAWSPDGSSLLFAAAGNRELWTVRRDGSELRRIASSGSTHYVDGPAWSPDGREIAFSQYVGSDNHLFCMAADGTAVRQLTRSGIWNANHTWAPR